MVLVVVLVPGGIAGSAAPAAVATALLVLAGKLAVIGAALAVIETINAKMRLFAVPTFLAVAFTLALIGMLSFIMLEAG